MEGGQSTSLKHFIHESIMADNSKNNNSPQKEPPASPSLDSVTSEKSLNAIPEPVEDTDGTTYFLLNVANEPEAVDKKEGKKPMHHNDNNEEDDDDKSSVSSKSSTDSSSSSVSAQVVIDHGSSIPRRMEKNGLGNLMRSGDDESESDYAFCYSPLRRESDTDSISKQASQLHVMASYDTDLSAADDHDGDDDLDEEEVEDMVRRHKAVSHTGGGKQKTYSTFERKRRRHHKHKHKHLLPRKGMVTVYTEEDDDLVDEMPTGDRERMLRHSERNYRRRSIPRRLHKRTQRVLQTNLQSQSWSRRESLQSSRHPGLSSEVALK